MAFLMAFRGDRPRPPWIAIRGLGSAPPGDHNSGRRPIPTEPILVFSCASGFRRCFGKGRMPTSFVRLIAVVVFGVLPAPARQDAVNFDWTGYGHELRTQMPKCVADAS